MDTLHEGASGVGNDDCGEHDLKQPSDIERQHYRAVTEVDTLHELGSALYVTLQVKEENLGRGSNLASEDAGSSGLDDENIAAGDCDINFDAFESTISNPPQKCPVFRDETFELGRNSSRHTASAGKLVSAMKGSREKEGIIRGKMRVSWAPDVYDPPPSTLSHNPKKKASTRQQIKSNKKHGKGKQKSRSTLGGGSGPKDKRHYRKVGGKSDHRCLDSCSDTDRLLSSNRHKSSAELLDLDDDDKDLQTPDSSCKGSYLGKTRGAMHFAYASAT